MKLKKRFSTVLCTALLYIISLSSIAFAMEINTEKEVASTEKAQVAYPFEEKFKLKVGYCPDYGMFIDEKGRVSGYVYDYMNEIARINHWDIEYISYDWADGMEKLKVGEIDVFGGQQKSTAREQLFDFPKYPMGKESASLFIREENETIFYNDLGSIDGKTVGVSSDNYYIEVLNEYCRQNKISVDIKEINDASELDREFESGEIDLRISSSMLIPSNSRSVLQFHTGDFYFPTTKGNTYVLNGMNYALEEIQKKDPYFDLRLHDRYIDRTEEVHMAFTEEEQLWIEENPVCKVGYDPTRMPNEYEGQAIYSTDEANLQLKTNIYDSHKSDRTHTTDKVPVGIEIDMLEKISAYSGLKFEYVKIDNYKEAMKKVKNGELDILAGFMGSQELAEKSQLTLSDPLLKTNLSFVSKRNYHIDSNPMVLALPANWIEIRQYIERNYPISKVVLFDTSKRCMDEVLMDRADITIQNALVVEQAIKPYRYRDLSASTMLSYEEFNVSLALNDGSQELGSILNKSISSISENEINQSVDEHTAAISYHSTFLDTIYANSSFLILIVFAFFFTLYLFSVNARKKLDQIAFYDSLTGEMNLRKFKIEVQKYLNNSKDMGLVTVIDIDKFKSINDMYGYDFGDQVLLILARNLRETVDINALICRDGADKFYIFCKQPDESVLENDFYSLAAKVENVCYNKKQTCRVVLRGGLCKIQPEDTNIASIMDHANIAAKYTKNSHVSTITMYTQSMYDIINSERKIENAMAAALSNNEFVVYLQPKVKLTNRKTMGAEALVRWINPEKGMIMPNTFIPLFEKNGFIVEIDYYVFEQVCKLLERWKKEGRALFAISVNLSRRHILNKETAKLLAETISKYDVSPNLIEIELTESAFVDCDVKIIIELLNELHAIGFSVSVDDFGSGYSSLSLLKEIPIDVLKIDRSFFTSGQTLKAEMLLESVITLSRKMNIKTVSEGVETVEQVNLLEQLGCDLVQGYYFARPMPIEELERLLYTKNDGAIHI